MNKVELLAPAGSFEALRAAVQNGCDAVYLGGTMFGARAFANNFEADEMAKAIAYAHIYGVRVFVTVNTLVKEDEMEQCLRYVKQLQSQDVDALIIQDIGLFTLVHEQFPDLELHASTQMHIHNPQGIQLLKSMGATRVVLPRETPVEQIEAYSRLGVELEVFVQGALCVSYSGQCLMSALTLQRSGNRGECAQNCRMQYTLEKKTPQGTSLCQSEGKYLLSPKDLNTVAMVPELIGAGITSFKIEGRMKRPEYVAYMVACYRKAIDAYYENTSFAVDQVMEEEMQKLFHRGFTTGHLFHQMDRQLMNPIRPNHIGIEIGIVTKVTRDKITIQLQKPLQQGDGIRIMKDKEDEGFRVNRIYKQGLLVSHGDAGDIIELDKTSYVDKGSRILKTSDVIQLKQLQETYEKSQRRVFIQGRVNLCIGKKAALTIEDELGHCVHVESEQLVEAARNTPLDKSRIEMQLRKSKDTPFSFTTLDIQLDQGCSMAISGLNQMRREALARMEEQRKNRNGSRRVQEVASPIIPQRELIREVMVIIHTYEQYLACVEANINYIFVEGRDLQKTLENKEHVYEHSPRVMKHGYASEKSMVQEAGGLEGLQPVFTNTSLNLTNAATAAFLFTRKAEAVSFSLESSLQECIHIASTYHSTYHSYGNFIYPIYGREELMLSEYCVIHAVEKEGTKKACGLCRGVNQYRLIDMKKHRYPLLGDEDCRMHILNEEPRNRLHEMAKAKEHHITSFLCVLTIEDKKTSRNILMQIQKGMEE